MQIDRQTDRETERQTGRQRDRKKKERQRDRETDRDETGRQLYRRACMFMRARPSLGTRTQFCGGMPHTWHALEIQ